MSRVIVYKQAGKSGCQGNMLKGKEPLIDRNKYMGDIEIGAGTEKLRVYGDSIEKLARVVSLNVPDGGVHVENGNRYAVKNSAGDFIRTLVLDDGEIQKFMELLGKALGNKGRKK